MKLDKENMLLYVVTDRTWLGDKSLVWQVEEALRGGATFLQLREKDLPLDEFIQLAKDIKVIAHRYQVPFIINDNVEVAVQADADGVHLGQKDGRIEEAREKLGFNKIIGLSAHNVEEALSAQQKGADYIGVGAVFQTATKKDASPLSFATLQEVCLTVEIPVVAIGGITKNNILQLSGSGVDGVAVISAVFAEPDICEATKELLKFSRKMVGKDKYV
jgi:thiamine-phosphate pyrophosphorylase